MKKLERTQAWVTDKQKPGRKKRDNKK